MSLELVAETPPLRRDSSGVLRVAGTRIPLETVLDAHARGLSPEQMVQEYPSLQLMDVYGVIAYCLRHRVEVDEYLHTRRLAAERTVADLERRSPQKGLRARLTRRCRR